MEHAGLGAFSSDASKAEGALLQAEATKVGKTHPASEIRSFAFLTGEVKEMMKFLQKEKERERERTNFSAPGSRAKTDGEICWGGGNHRDYNSKP